MTTESRLDRSVAFKLAGHLYRLSGREVLGQARQALADGIPPETQRYRRWVVDVDGQPVSVKWLLSLATGVDVGQFVTSHARHILQRMGIEVQRLEQATPPITPKVLAHRRAARQQEPPDDTQYRYGLLDAEIRSIRDFLDGATGTRPTDERLCYWVYFCLTFELHNEGRRLLTLIDPSQVPATLYERTSRFAQACRVRAEVQV